MGRAISIALMREGLATAGLGTVFTTGSGGLSIGAVRARMSVTIPPGIPFGRPFGTPPGTPGPAAKSGPDSSSIISALGGILAGNIRRRLKTCDAPPTAVLGWTTGPGGGGAPGAEMVAIHAARGSACGEIMGASTAQVTSSACPVTPANVVQTRLDGGP